MKSDEEFMHDAIEEALVGKEQGQKPFGCVVVNKKGEIIAQAHDTVIKDSDITSHSEVTAIRMANQKLGLDLSGCTVYTTCEPCPMCFGAMWLAKVDTVVFGSYMSDVVKITNGKMRQLDISAEQLNQQSGSKIKVIKEVLRNECRALWDDKKL